MLALEKKIENNFQRQGLKQFRPRRNGDRKKCHRHAFPVGTQQFKDVQCVWFFQVFRLMVNTGLEAFGHGQVNCPSLIAVAHFKSGAEVARVPVFDAASNARMPIAGAESFVENKQRIYR
jgi:hypothetical protein